VFLFFTAFVPILGRFFQTYVLDPSLIDSVGCGILYVVRLWVVVILWIALFRIELDREYLASFVIGFSFP